MSSSFDWRRSPTHSRVGIQIFEGISVNLEESDTEVLFQTLNDRIAERRKDGSGSNVDVDGIVTEVFESIEGP
jgi:hypothetical protein